MADKIKVLYLFDKLDTGGAERLLVTTLKHLDMKKFDIRVCSIQRGGDLVGEIEELGFKVSFLDTKCNLCNLKILFRLVRLLKKLKPEIVNTQSFYPSLHGRIAAKLTGIPVVVATEHGTVSYKKKLRHKIIDHLLAKVTNRIIVVSNSVKVFTSTTCRIPDNKFSVIHNAVDFSRFENIDQVSDLRDELGLGREDKVIGTVATVVPWKGQKYLIQAFSAILGHFKKVSLIIAGDDPIGYRRELEDEAGRLGVEKKVYFLGLRTDIPRVLKTIDLFAFPSLTEGLGIAAMEAMAVGLPVVASDVEGIREIITDSETGILVPPRQPSILSDKIIDLLDNNQRAYKIGQGARRGVVLDFSPSVYCSKLENLYVDLYKTKGNVRVAHG